MEQRDQPEQPEQRGGASRQRASSGHACPECGTAREADNTPACACGTRASDALRDARTAQAAAAEDFDPLRIRPYVELDDAGGAKEPEGEPRTDVAREDGARETSARHTAPPSSAPGTPDAPGTAPDAEATMTLRAVGAGQPPVTGASAAAAAAAAAGAVEATSVLPTPLAPSTGAPSAHDLRLFETSATAAAPAVTPVEPGTDGTDGRPPRKRRRGVLLSAAGAVVVVVGAAGFASGLFSYESPSRDGALPEEVRASVPDPSTSAAPTGPESSTPSAAETSASPSPSASASASTSPSPSPSPSASASSASPSPPRSAETSPSATTTPPGAAAQETEDDDRDHDYGGGPTLQRGDRGSEVVELQQRLTQLYLYNGDINGNYNHQVEDSVRTYQWARGIRSDELGTYGRDTRRMLETETREP
ncbi:peptidoglycan-binding domain-containing protein [Streptomyces enissocaesilis]|uniref:peptidoglycan-binding domain-containing protein n=1 Tax=Streptomyces TaxID=1883 RepID=UPI002798CD1A|nr:peptidoglycan-binding domain-containing protein [Streptomyces enissocaesilis]